MAKVPMTAEALEMFRRWGRQGGKARAKRLTPEARRAAARHAAKAAKAARARKARTAKRKAKKTDRQPPRGG